jgi:hypothetical protein
LIVYLDQSSLSRMIREPEVFDPLRKLLIGAVHSGRVICPRSPAHADESVLAQPHTWLELDQLAHDLSPGVRFLTAREIENNEIRAAARELLAKDPEESWPEAFTADPHTSTDPTITIFRSQVTVRPLLPPTDLDRAEVIHEKDKETALTDAYREVRERYSFQEICQANLGALLEWKLGPLASTSKFLTLLRRREREVAEEQARGRNPLRPGSALSQLHAVHQRAIFITELVRELPELRCRDAEFFESRELRTLPSLMLQAYLRAGLEATAGRRAKPSDAYDVVHLAHGLSRCDLVTADRGMVEMVGVHGLVSRDVTLFESSDVDGLIGAVRAHLEGE